MVRIRYVAAGRRGVDHRLTREAQKRPGKPGTLAKLKKWLTIPEAARYLALIFGEDVVEADVLRLGLDGHLRLSVRFVNFAYAVRHRERTPAEAAESMALINELAERVRISRQTGSPKPPPRPPSTPAQRPLAAATADEGDRNIVTLRDEVYDLPMIGGERLDVEHEYERQTGGPEITLINIDGTFVDAEDGTRFSLRDRLPAETLHIAAGSKKVPVEWYPAGGLPENSVLVVRSAALHALETRVSEASALPDFAGRPLGERERATLLTIIAALADAAGIDILKPSKAAGTIEALTVAKGARVSARSIEDHLKSIPDALERRGKLTS